MSIVEIGKTVILHYSGREKDGETITSTFDKSPFKLTIGQSETLKGFEKNILGLKSGDKKSFLIEPKDAFGEVNQELIGSVNKSSFKNDKIPPVGEQIQLITNDENVVTAKIIEIKDETVIVDANHPLAGKSIEFNVEILEVKDNKQVNS